MDPEFETIRGAHFGKEDVPADGREFIDCTFEGTTLVFRGVAAFIVAGGSGSPNVEFADHAYTTMEQLAAMYRFGQAGIVENLFDQVRNPNQDTIQ